MRLLLSAFACAPGYGSEPGIGWGIVSQVSRKHETWVLTCADNQRSIEQAIAQKPCSNAHFVFADLPGSLGSRAIKSRFHHIYYILWQFEAYRVAKLLHKKIGFDLVQHVTYGSFWMPSLMGYLGVPFVWAAGLKDEMPVAFLRDVSWRSLVRELARNAVMRVFGPVNSLVTAHLATMIITSSDPKLWGSRLPVKRLFVGGLSEEETDVLGALPCAPHHGSSLFRVASIGRLMGLKGFSLGIRAFARLANVYPSSEYWIIGDGPERSYLLRLAANLNCERNVRFLGWIPREELLEILPSIDVLLHPSFHEQFGYVVLEAMAAGKPVVCIDKAGPSGLVSEDCGFKIQVTDPRQVVNEIFAALAQLASNNAKRMSMGAAARKRAGTIFSWSRKGEEMFEVYSMIVKPHSPSNH
ncbi:MAG: glycosyltransferase [Deltaproteobacteria bacterium]|nr:glycosyltransferase [Deltaproteobacteria bacterium]